MDHGALPCSAASLDPAVAHYLRPCPLCRVRAALRLPCHAYQARPLVQIHDARRGAGASPPPQTSVAHLAPPLEADAGHGRVDVGGPRRHARLGLALAAVVVDRYGGQAGLALQRAVLFGAERFSVRAVAIRRGGVLANILPHKQTRTSSRMYSATLMDSSTTSSPAAVQKTWRVGNKGLWRILGVSVQPPLFVFLS